MPLNIRHSMARIAAAAGLTAVLALGGGAHARDEVAPGKPAPAFTARDSNGKDVSLASLKGKTVVLEWTNEHCPYVKKHYGTGAMQALQKHATSKDVVWLTIASSAVGAQGYVDGIEADKLTADRKAVPTKFLLDPDGKVGRSFGATVTPHMFVIDRDGRVAYMGGIDDKPSTNPADVATARPYVREAVDQIVAGQPVKTASTRPYGCTIKYAVPKS